MIIESPQHEDRAELVKNDFVVPKPLLVTLAEYGELNERNGINVV